MTGTGLCEVSPIIDAIKPRHTSLAPHRLAILISLLRIPSTHGQDHPILHISEHLRKRFSSIGIPAIINISTEILPQSRTCVRLIMFTICGCANIQCWQINALAILHVETSDGIIVKLCDDRELFRCINFKI